MSTVGNWFYSQNRKKLGPISQSQLAELARAGALKPTDMVLPEGQSKWQEARSVDGLFTIAENGTPPPPPLTATVVDARDLVAAPVATVAIPDGAITPLPIAQEVLMAPSAPTQPLAEAELTLPTVPGYEILGVLGRGGMGVVYRARHQQLKRVVALKMMLAGAHADQNDLTRFRTEAESVASLQHPNIVQIYEVGDQNGLPYCALEFVDGGSLSQKLGGMPQSARSSADMTLVLARAMHAAHQRGIIHRDLKPANVLLNRDGQPKITDFGLAKKLDDNSGQTRTGAVMGTPSYMSPEQAQGKIKELGPATDIYALGAMLYEMLTGRPPFRGETPLDTLLQAMSEEPVPPSRLHHKVPRDLETICLKCLEKDPARRYASAVTLADDVERFLEDRPILARPLNLKERAVKWARRHPAVTALLLLFALAVVIGSSGILWNWRQAVVARHDAETAKKQAEQHAREAQQALDEAERTLYSNRIALAHREWQSRHVGRADELLNECPPPLRNWEWRYLQRMCHAEIRTLTGHTDQVMDAVYSPDGSLIASASLDKTVRLWDAATGEPRGTLTGHGDTVRRVAFSPDGRHLASASHDKTVKVWNVESGREVMTYRGHDKKVSDVVFHRGGARIFSVAGEVRIWEWHTGRNISVLPSEVQDFIAVSASGDGSRLAGVRFKGPVEVWDLASGKTIQRLGVTERITYGVAISADGKKLVPATSDTILRSWEVDTGKPLITLRGHVDLVSRVAFSPDGRSLASVGSDQTAYLWDMRPNGDVISKRGHTAPVYGVSFSPDGKFLATASGDHTIKIWDTATDPECGIIRVSDHQSLALHPDQQRLAVGGRDGLKILNVHTGRELISRTAPGSAVAFSPDRSTLAVSAYGEGGYRIHVLDAQTGQERFVLSTGDGDIPGLAFSPDGKLLAAAYDSRNEAIDPVPGVVRLWDIARRRQVHMLRGHNDAVLGVAFHPGGKLVASASADRTIKLWNVDDGVCQRTLSGHGRSVRCLAFSATGDILASGSHDSAIKLWNVASGAEIRTLRGHSQAVNAVAFNPDGSRLASAGGDRTLKLWDPMRGQELLNLVRHAGDVTDVVFKSNGDMISVGGDQKVRIWEASK